MAKKADKKKAKPIARKTATIPPPKKTDSKDTVLVGEQLNVIKAATTEHQLDVIADADNRPGVVIAIQARRDELKKAADDRAAKAAPVAEPKVEAKPEEKFPDKELDKIDAKLLAPVADDRWGPVLAKDQPPPANSAGSVAAVEPTAPVPVVEEPVKKPEPKPEPVTPLEGGVLGSLCDEAEDEQEIASQKSQAQRAAEVEAKLKNPRVAAAHARTEADRVSAEAKHLDEVARFAEAKVAAEEAKAKPAAPKPAPKVEENVEGKPAAAEEKSGSSAPPNALLA